MLFIAKTTAVIIAGMICLFFYARYLENKSLYYPTRNIEQTPKDINIEYEDIFFLTEDNLKLNAWFIKAKNPRATIIFCHGNGGNISHRLDKIAFFHKLEVNIFIFDYRGYGKSQGKPNENGLYQDVQAADKFIKDKQLGVPIILYGESLGGAIAIDLAARTNIAIDGLILEGSFSNIQDMAKLIYPLLPTALLKTKFDATAKIPKVKVPKLHFHGNADQIVPIELGRKLFNAAKNPKKFITLDGGHNDCFFISSDLVRSSLNELIDSLAVQP
jgi:uncharacterized protein